MPRYFFDLRDANNVFMVDDRGLEVSDIEAAGREAALAAVEMVRDKLVLGNAGSLAVEVRDERGQIVIVAVVTLQIERVTPSSEH